MSFSFNLNELDQPINQLRFLVQDTVGTGHLLEDEEISLIIGQHTVNSVVNINRAAARLSRVLAMKFASMPNIEDPVLKLKADERAKEFRLLAATFDDEAVRLDELAEEASDNASQGEGLAIDSLYKKSDYGPAFRRNM